MADEEYGFWDSVRGYVQSTGDPSDSIKAKWPAGWRSVPLKPGDGYDYDLTANDGAGGWIYAPNSKAEDDVNTERDRRIEAGAEFTLSTGTVIAITGRERDKAVLVSQFLAAQGLVAGGETGAVMVYRDRSNVNRMLTPPEMIELFTLGMAWVEAVMRVAWDMKDGTGVHTAGIPNDLENDSYWP